MTLLTKWNQHPPSPHRYLRYYHTHTERVNVSRGGRVSDSISFNEAGAQWLLEWKKTGIKRLMVMEDILRREGSDTRLVFLSGEKKSLHQAGGAAAAQDAVNCVTLKSCVRSLGRGRRTADCRSARGRNGRSG